MKLIITWIIAMVVFITFLPFMLTGFVIGLAFDSFWSGFLMAADFLDMMPKTEKTEDQKIIDHLNEMK